MNVEDQPEKFYGQTLQREEGAAGSSAGGSVVAASPMSFSPGAILGLTYVSTVGTAHNSPEQYQRGKGEAQNFSQRANMVAIHSDLNQTIVIN